MVSEDIGILRDLGKRAAWVLRGLRVGLDQLDHGLAHTADGNETDDDEAEETNTTAPDISEPDQHDQADILAAAKARILLSLPGGSEGLPDSANSPDTRSGPANVEFQPGITQDDATDNRQQITRLLVTLDMIITVVGEFYGQRDLLGGRLVWGELDMNDD